MIEAWNWPQEIKTERLTLNRFEEKDLSELHEIAIKLNADVDEKGLSPFYAFYVPKSSPQRDKEVYQKAHKYLQGLINIHSGEIDIYGYAVRLKGKLIGYVGLWFQKENNKIIKDIGYFIDPEYQGRGYAIEANKAMCEVFFKDFDEIVGTTNPKNLSSGKVLEKLGFLKTGYIDKSKYDGDPRIKWTLTKEDFEKKFKK